MKRTARGDDVRLGVLAVLLFGLAGLVTGRIEEQGGLGWDGEHYARALRGDFDGVSPNVLLRPAILLLNAPAYWLTGDALTAFAAMNYVYVLALSLGVCSIFNLYSSDRRAKVLLVINLFLCIAVARMFAFYPSLIDLGACAVIVAATRAVLGGSWAVAGAAGLVAVLSREFGIAVVVFGFIRQVRTTGRIIPALVCWSPAVLAMAAMRAVVSRQGGPGMIDAGALLQNAHYWRDPVYVLLFAYFLLTVFGGVSLAVFTSPRASWALFRGEPEWGAFVVLIVLAAALGSADVWRYLLFLLPVVPAAFAAAWSATPASRQRAFAVTVTLTTLLTQRPWQPIDEFIYFRDWFPLYMRLGLLPGDLAVELWPLWAWRLTFVVILAAALIVARRSDPAIARRWVSWAAAAVVAVCGIAWLAGLRPVLRPPSFGTREATVRWAPHVDSASRRDLEARYGLEPYRHEGDRTWRYRFTAASRIDELLMDPRVEDTHHFDWRWRYTYYLELLAPARVSLERRHLPITRLE